MSGTFFCAASKKGSWEGKGVRNLFYEAGKRFLTPFHSLKRCKVKRKDRLKAGEFPGWDWGEENIFTDENLFDEPKREMVLNDREG